MIDRNIGAIVLDWETATGLVGRSAPATLRRRRSGAPLRYRRSTCRCASAGCRSVLSIRASTWGTQAGMSTDFCGREQS